MGFSKSFRRRVPQIKGNRCVVNGCGRNPSKESRDRDKISVHPINGDPDDERLENAIPACQSCIYHIYRLDEPPYRYYHRQLPVEKRVTQQHAGDAYEGEKLTAEEASEFKAEDGEPYSVKYKNTPDH